MTLGNIPAIGPNGLTDVLNDLLAQREKDPSFSREHFILYQLGNQKALIRVDTSQKPFQFWYYDLLGRPATKIVKETIARFLWDKCGEKERYLRVLEGE